MTSLTAQAQTLSADQVKSVMVGKKITFVSNDGSFKAVARYKRNGSAKINASEPRKFSENGQWRIDGNKFCSSWETIRGGNESCYNVQTTDQEVVYKVPTGFFRSK